LSEVPPQFSGVEGLRMPAAMKYSKEGVYEHLPSSIADGSGSGGPVCPCACNASPAGSPDDTSALVVVVGSPRWGLVASPCPTG
jgi:hypothetical protein